MGTPENQHKPISNESSFHWYVSFLVGGVALDYAPNADDQRRLTDAIRTIDHDPTLETLIDDVLFSRDNAVKLRIVTTATGQTALDATLNATGVLCRSFDLITDGPLHDLPIVDMRAMRTDDALAYLPKISQEDADGTLAEGHIPIDEMYPDMTETRASIAALNTLHREVGRIETVDQFLEAAQHGGDKRT